MISITTYSKCHFASADPDIKKMHIVDISHALSIFCRANGWSMLFLQGRSRAKGARYLRQHSPPVR